MEILGGLYNLRLPAETFTQLGIYTLYIRPAEIRTSITDCGVLSALPNVKGIVVDLNKVTEPKTDNHLVIEGAGGILVPLNDSDCIIDLIQKDYKVIVVSRHYLGSINHTLLTIEALKSRKISVAGIIFSGDENKATEEIILKKSGAVEIKIIEKESH